ncbi:MAG TPA: hypothetical protein VMF61_07110 [Candidatus Acidoferrales bacterium]|nr:hypothetical protein [Candidatus Acidoferrales bacterium]
MSVRRTIAAGVAISIALAGLAAYADVPAPAPAVFAPGVVSGEVDSAPVFSPDGKTMLFTRSATVLESRRTGDGWSQPSIAAFSGVWPDMDPAFAPDGSYVVFVSRRPVGNARPANLWRVDRTPAGWGSPVRLPDRVNLNAYVFAPSIAADGTLYFLRSSARFEHQLYRARLRNGSYLAPEALSFSNPATKDYDPGVAPDQSYIVFASLGRNGAADKQLHLFIAFARGDGWSGVQRLRYAGDVARGSGSDSGPLVAADGTTLYFVSNRIVRPPMPRTLAQAEIDLRRLQQWNNGNSNAWRLDLQAVLPELRASASASP